MQTSHHCQEDPPPAGAARTHVKDASLVCVACGHREPGPGVYRCPRCGGVVEVDIHLTPADWDTGARPLIGASQWVYRARLPVRAVAPITLGEGSTPLLEALPSLAGPGFSGRLLIKDETGNPTGSFKDRLVSVAVTRALQDGSRGIVCASTGNAGASAAAYAARAGLPCVVTVPASAPPAKLRQIQAYGAAFVAVHGTYSDAWAVADELQRTSGFTNVTTTYQNPYGVSALRTVAYELLDAMNGQVPDAVFVPTGSGPLVRGVAWGYQEAFALGIIERVPRLVAVQAEGCAPIVAALERGSDVVEAWPMPTTAAAGIADPLHGYVQDGTYTLSVVRATGGWAVAVTDDAMRTATSDLALNMGVFAELSGAAGLAGLRVSDSSELLPNPATAVVLVTGSGFKDFDTRTMPPLARFDFDPASGDVAALATEILGSWPVAIAEGLTERVHGPL